MMTNSQHSESKAFYLLHPTLQRWIWKQRWTNLRDIQEEAIHSILANDRDVIISAATAGGKTEAAFLPVLSDVLRTNSEGVAVLGIIPLKALINDQYQRLESLTQATGIPVFAWHGDVTASKKNKALASSGSVLLITPESLEALFVTRPDQTMRAFRSLNRIIVDELHVFIGAERGRQLQSLMHRVEYVVGKKIPRIGLSATLGDMLMASDFLRHDKTMPCDTLQAKTGGRELRVQLRGYHREISDDKSNNILESKKDKALAKHLFNHLRGSNNLIFSNSRMGVEGLTDDLRALCDELKMPNEFFPHHGNLSKSFREDIESRIKKQSLPTSVVCTSSLELGIDIGSVKSVAQIGPPPSVSSLCQRIGRSGRTEGAPAILRNYITEFEHVNESKRSLDEILFLGMIQAIAMIHLLVRGWVEPPYPDRLHLSTFVQQLLSVITQYNGARPVFLWNLLCETGPFSSITIKIFKHILTRLGEKDVLHQSKDGTLLLGLRGEKIVEHYGFYAAFMSPEELTVVAGGKVLGTLCPNKDLCAGVTIVFAGRRWIVNSYDQQRKQLHVSPSSTGKVPVFYGGEGPIVHDEVRSEMVRCLKSSNIPIFLDVKAKEMLEKARSNFAKINQNGRILFRTKNNTTFIIWKGDKVCYTIHLLLLRAGLSSRIAGCVFQVSNVSPDKLLEILEQIISQPLPEESDLTKWVEVKGREKYDYLLDDYLLDVSCCVGLLDLEGARIAVAEFCTAS
ncbi:DEAD/DEAH box helicase [Paucidesulfovibrio longus]|uniref:DEAD/DEAH box helicase n=1 Tax=Paucidesulfovibrio longus TaxID=889 RepID=UPI00041DC362|nr:DEAD/DEAH box helicase [Paucidesulfovibrio longus]